MLCHFWALQIRTLHSIQPLLFSGISIQWNTQTDCIHSYFCEKYDKIIESR